MNTVKLRVNGVDYAGWLEVEISAGIERQARDFKLGITRAWPGAKDIPRRVKRGDVCEVFIDADKVLTGYVDATPISYDANNISVVVIGRSKTQDLIDCSATHKTGQWRNTKIENITRDLAAPYGVKVLCEVETGGTVSDHQIDTGETAFESLGRLLSIRQLLSTDNASGELVLVNVGSAGKAYTSLVYGENILSGSAGLDGKDIFSEYTSKGQRAGNDQDFAEAVAEVLADIKNSQCTRYRNLILTQIGNATTLDCQQRVRYERDYRNARELETTYTVQGWRQGNGALWVPNLLVRVIDPIIGFDNELLITEVTYRISEGGTICSLQVAPKEGYIPSPQTTKKEKAKKTNKGGGDKWADIK